MESLPPDVREYLESYTPVSIPPSGWQSIRPLVIAAAAASAPGAVNSLKDRITVFTHHVHGRFVDGCEMTLDDVFCREAVETQIAMWREAVEAGVSLMKVHTVRSYAARLRRYAPSISPRTWEKPSERIAQRTTLAAPYSDDELVEIERGLRQHPDEVLSERIRTAVHVGLGVGATAGEAQVLRGTDVFIDADGRVRVRFRFGDGTVDVPAAEPYAATILAAAQRAGSGPLIPVTDGKDAYAWLLRAPLGRDVPALHSGRLRTTWLCDRIRAGVSIAVLARYARLTSNYFLRDLPPYLPVPDPDETDAALRRSPRDEQDGGRSE